jgi:hypothetical protein
MEVKTMPTPPKKKGGKQRPPLPHTHTHTHTKKKEGGFRGWMKGSKESHFSGISILNKGCSYILDGVGKHQL